MKTVTLKEAADLMNVKLSSLLSVKAACEFPQPVGNCRKKGAACLYNFKSVQKAYTNRVSLKTKKQVGQPWDRKGKLTNEGGQYIHYGEYECDKKWPTHRSNDSYGSLGVEI